MLAPGSGFYSNPDLGKKEVRIAYVLNLDDLKKAMECLRRGLAAYPGRVNRIKGKNFRILFLKEMISF